MEKIILELAPNSKVFDLSAFQKKKLILCGSIAPNTDDTSIN